MQKINKASTGYPEPDLSNRPRKVRVIQPWPTPVPVDNAMGNVQPIQSAPTPIPVTIASSASNSGAFIPASLPTQPSKRPRERPRKQTEEVLALGAAEMQPITFEQAELDRTRKDLVDARIQFEDDRWLQKQRDSDLRAWCKPVTRDVQLDAVQSFYKAMFDETTLETQYCVVFGLQKSSQRSGRLYVGRVYGLYV
ncbi:hypothetical protein V8E54_011875 [Elaphomyces granulatus]